MRPKTNSTRHGHVLRSSDVKALKSSKAPGVNHRTVECLDCGAGLGEFCVSANGKRVANSHVARRRLAVRLLNEANS